VGLIEAKQAAEKANDKNFADALKARNSAQNDAEKIYREAIEPALDKCRAVVSPAKATRDAVTEEGRQAFVNAIDGAWEAFEKTKETAEADRSADLTSANVTEDAVWRAYRSRLADAVTFREESFDAAVNTVVELFNERFEAAKPTFDDNSLW